MMYVSSREYKALKLTKIWVSTLKSSCSKTEIMNAYLWFLDELTKKQDGIINNKIIVDELHDFVKNESLERCQKI